jgi:hypothetical protein
MIKTPYDQDTFGSGLARVGLLLTPVICRTLRLGVSSFKLEDLFLPLESWFKLARLRSSLVLKLPSSKGCRMLLLRPLMMNLTKSFLFANRHLRNHMMIT